MSKKAVKLGSFLQCSVHIFLGHDGLRINLKLLWNHIMKNFQVKHGQCDSIIFLKIFSSLILLTGPGIYPHCTSFS